jgi:hypothetical protein
MARKRPLNRFMKQELDSRWAGGTGRGTRFYLVFRCFCSEKLYCILYYSYYIEQETAASLITVLSHRMFDTNL